MFDGLALLHQFKIKDGSVFYSNKLLKGDTYEKVMKAKRIVLSDFGTRAFPDPCKSLLQQFMSYFTMGDYGDNCCVNVYTAGDAVYASTETTHLRKIDPQTIETLDRVNLDEFVAVNVQTAHPQQDKDGTVYNLGSRFGKNGKYCVIKIPPSQTVEHASILAEIPASNPLYPSYYHSFCITENYIVFVEQPLVISLPSLQFMALLAYTFCDALVWKPNLKAKFHIICKQTGKILPTTYVSEAFFFFHSINAYESENAIVCDLCCYDDGRMVQGLYHQNMDEIQSKCSAKGEKGFYESKYGPKMMSQGRRYVLPLDIIEDETVNLVKIHGCDAKAFWKKNEVQLEYETLTEKGPNVAEMPRINYDYNGRPYRYFYSIRRSAVDYSISLMKCDTESKKVLEWSEEGFYPSEPVFIPRPDAVEEDDGVVLSSVLSKSEENQGFLLVLDGKSFQVLAKAHFETPSAIPSDFHGVFFEDPSN